MNDLIEEAVNVTTKAIVKGVRRLRALESEENFDVDRHDDSLKEIKEKLEKLRGVRHQLECLLGGSC